jgi:predicted dehydrogenase
MNDRATIAIAGCGAVTERYYMPALEALQRRVQVLGVYDSDPARARLIANAMPGAYCAESFDALLNLGADLVIVASPPAFHAEQAIAALGAGSHVLCEKPMALARREADAMTDAARRHDRLLAVNMVRRHFPASHIVGTLVGADSLGALRSISVFEGGPFRWPVRDQGYFSHAVSGGGVLPDIGTHVVDLLGAWFGGAQFVRYADDAVGGVEANARLTLRYGDAPAVICLSRDWGQPNQIEMRFEKGQILWRAAHMERVELRLEGAEPLMLANEGARNFRFVDCFVAQIGAMLELIGGRPADIVTAEQALATIALIEQAQAERQALAMPWLAPVEGRAHG